MNPHVFIWGIAVAAAAAVMVRPFGWPEAVWPVLGSAALLCFGLIGVHDALIGMGNGTDVYLFLTGMMLLAEVAREEKLFDWLAAMATRHAQGSARRLFLLIYGVGIVVTAFLSNDATAVVLTPAVAAAVKAAKATKPLPYLFICAFIANAASFILPISNPANLVIYGTRMPGLWSWLPRYLLPSVVSIVVTYGVLRWTQREALRESVSAQSPVPRLSAGGQTVAVGILMTSVVLLLASMKDMPLGLPTLLAGVLTTAVVLIRLKKWPWKIVRGISWGVLPLVAGLFVLVKAVGDTGLIHRLGDFLSHQSAFSAHKTAAGAGCAIALLCNVLNNLPVGLIGGQLLHSARMPDVLTRATLIGVDVGPNLSVTGSLATLLWLQALRREGYHITAWEFLRLGVLIMPATLVLTLAACLL